MKFFYVGLESFNESSADLFQRISSQVTGVSQLGNEAHSVCMSNGELLFCTGSQPVRYPLPEQREKHKKFLCDMICKFIEKNQYDYIYLRGFLANHTFLEIATCAKAKCFGAKVIFEAARYPDRPVCKQMLHSYRESGDKASYMQLYSRIVNHKLLLSRFTRVVDTIVVFGTPVEQVWGIPALTVDTGITVSEIARRSNTEIHGDPIAVLGVVDDPKLCGYDRIIQGLKTYQSNVHRDEITFDIVGDNEAVCELKKMTEESGLNHCIYFLGKRTQKEMNELYNTHSVAISCLGLYRSGGTYLSPKIAKEYCAAGIPFVYAYDDLGLDDNIPFALKLANNDSPINISLIGEFVWRCRLDQRLSQTERKFAEKYYDWRVIMKRIIEFTATGRREV